MTVPENSFAFVAGLPHLDVYTLAEDWMLAQSLYAHWQILAAMTGRKPSEWIDAAGDRMYAGVLALETEFDLDAPVMEDDEVSGHCRFLAVRRPHAWSTTTFSVGGTVRARTNLMTSFIKRQSRGSNKKFSKVADLWSQTDFNTELVDAVLDAHHKNKSVAIDGDAVLETPINRIQDFNTADFLYFKNYVRIAKAAEWVAIGRQSSELNRRRRCFYYGNVEDGTTLTTRVGRAGPAATTSHHSPEGRMMFVSTAEMQAVAIPVR